MYFVGFCQIGKEREVAACLMQKYIDKGAELNLQIRSVIALDHLKNFIYIEADKEAHVREVRIHLFPNSDWWDFWSS